jgi:hypothetical protein
MSTVIYNDKICYENEYDFPIGIEDFTLDQREFIFDLNKKINSIEQEIQKKCNKLNFELNKRVNDHRDLLYNYEIICRITLLLKENDVDFDLSRDNALMELIESMKDYDWASDIEYNNNDIGETYRSLTSCEHYCSLFHKLYEYLNLEQMLRIGSITYDIKITYYNSN